MRLPEDLRAAPGRPRSRSAWTVAALLLLAAVAATVLPSACASALPDPPPGADLVILVHGLGRTSASMDAVERDLRRSGFAVANLDYPSRSEDFDQLVEDVGARIDALAAAHPGPVHLVTHSMGGLLVRARFADHRPPNLGRVVMLAPPNQGSELVDEFGDWPGFEWVAGEAGTELGTGPDGVASRLAPVDYETGIIAGNGTLNPLYSALIPGDDDGKVAVERARVAGMTDFVVVPHSHTFLMRFDDTLHQVESFLRKGRFDHGAGTDG